MFNNNDNYLKIISLNLFIITTVVVVYLLNLGSSLILPFVISLFISFGIISISGFFKNLGANKFFSFLLSFLSFFAFFFLIGWIINSNITEMTKPEKIDFYQNRLDSIITPVLDYASKFNIDEQALKEKLLKNVDFTSIFGTITNVITIFLSNAGLIIIYTLFILLEYRYFKEKIDLIIANPIKKSKFNSITNKIKNDVKGYFLIKTLTSITTGFLSYIALKLAGVDFALFWSFIIFFLNFIPTVGSIIAVSIISIFIILQLGFVFNSSIIITILIGIQIFIGNVVEPKLMGSRLNLSPLVILLSLGLWGVIWGVVGMLLSVPIMVTINIILSKFDSTKSISILLSEKGIIESDEDLEETKKKLYKLLLSIKK